MGSALRSDSSTIVPLRAETAPEVTKRVAIVDGALACIAAKGLRATTVDDVARASGMSRATLYRTIPGGRDAIIQATAETEVARFFSALAVAMGAATTLEAALVSGITTSARWISDSAALTTLLDVEPWVILRHISFGQMDRALTLAVDFTGPFFGRWLEPEQAARAAEAAAAAKGGLAPPTRAWPRQFNHLRPRWLLRPRHLSPGLRYGFLHRVHQGNFLLPTGSQGRGKQLRVRLNAGELGRSFSKRRSSGCLSLCLTVRIGLHAWAQWTV